MKLQFILNSFDKVAMFSFRMSDSWEAIYGLFRKIYFTN